MPERTIPPIRLGINIDHAATLRQVRGTRYPDPVEAALLAASAGADSITLHLREDRRHIQDRDLERLLPRCPVPVNLEMAVTPEMVGIACRLRPRFACLVPERRQERTTEGGLDIIAAQRQIKDACARLAGAGVAVALFVAPDTAHLQAIAACGAPHLEIHTGHYADALTVAAQTAELQRIRAFASAAGAAGLEVHAGHGLNVENVGSIARIEEIVELNIGHSIIASALFVGLPAAVAEMRRAMVDARYGLGAGA
ncbi:MAG: pyridoxine 5'-phosphate synthase [Nevskia sp.]|nr:pyridoxine 5'-phosphate synthase [Nevskia sp.]